METGNSKAFREAARSVRGAFEKRSRGVRHATVDQYESASVEGRTTIVDDRRRGGSRVLSTQCYERGSVNDDLVANEYKKEDETSPRLAQRLTHREQEQEQEQEQEREQE